MVQPTAKDLLAYVNREMTWVLRHGETTLRLPVIILDAKNAYGRTRFLCLIANQEIWLDETSITSNK